MRRRAARAEAALQAAKARSQKLGSPDSSKALKVRQANALHYAETIKPGIVDIQAKGIASLRGIVHELSRQLLQACRQCVKNDRNRL